MNQLGYWTADRCGLPAFAYTGALPYAAVLPNGAPVKLPADPWFLLGNYRLTLFTHVSGEYELISGQRAWARINQGEGRNSGRNAAEITVNGWKYALTGMQSLAADPSVCARSFGCGFAEYAYRTGEVEVRRNLSVKPSATPYDGASGFLLTVTVRNNGTERVECGYAESVGARFEEIRFQTQPQENLPLRYR
ncbi:MAG: hypothetical protein ACI4XW_05480, partial [Candidatus Spyradocola sp.]